jgi:bifunctional non-homologous end joining protein LigD
MLLDGEVVAVDAGGHPSFQALQHRASTPLTLVYYVFDVLALNGRDLKATPLETRRSILARLPLTAPILRSDPLPGTPQQIEHAVRALGLEGVVAKRLDSRYEPGRRSDAWLKVKFSLRQEFVIGGCKPAGDTFDSILVGYYKGRELWYASKVRAGFTPAVRRELFERLRPLGVTRCPFANLPTGKTSQWGEGVTAEEMKTLRWVRPKLVAEIAFTEWTREGSLRHATFVGLREDKPARRVRRE